MSYNFEDRKKVARDLDETNPSFSHAVGLRGDIIRWNNRRTMMVREDWDSIILKVDGVLKTMDELRDFLMADETLGIENIEKAILEINSLRSLATTEKYSW